MIEDTIKLLVKENYNIDVESIRKLNRGSANLYSLNNDLYVLKEFQSKYKKEDIEKEIRIIETLRKDNIPVPEYIKRIDGNYCFEYLGRIITLQNYIKGYTLESNTGNYEQMMESARLLGRIVKSLKTLDFELEVKDIDDWYSEDIIKYAIRKHNELLNKTTDERVISDLKNKIRILSNILEDYNKNRFHNITLLNTHGDYSLLQFIYNDSKVVAVIDFVSACKMPIIWEIIRSYSYIDKNCIEGKIDINNLCDYIKEFSKFVSLTKEDILGMSYFYMVQLACSTYGYKEYLNDNTKIDLLNFGYFRTKLCEYLYDNMEDITKRLEYLCTKIID